MAAHEAELTELVRSSRFLVLGGAGSIGQAVVKELFRRGPRKLHVVDISENNLVEVVRDVRSSLGYIAGDFQTYALDIGSPEYDAFFRHDGEYDYVLNLSALKHVRSERDPFTLMRMIQVNVVNTDRTARAAAEAGARKYFCVSTDKATNPVNMMGASKRIMELFLARRSRDIDVSTARFANVAFSDGSLLHGFEQRLAKRQPIVAPDDVRRYFVTPKESGELCLMSCLLGGNGDVFFPKLSDDLHLITFAEIALNYLRGRGFEPVLCESEEEARALAATLPDQGRWPCLFSTSDTTGEKAFEEFHAESDDVDWSRFANLGVIRDAIVPDPAGDAAVAAFEERIAALRARGSWDKREIVELFTTMVPEFHHQETGTYLDGKM
ncbi:MAG TPA: UDP-N-acetylglucosamine 4,6-dehydratase [Nocardioides sp.]|uniref:UDP-N-acetylglucosamine 4,6-dehydratase n=1 Tax=Nocardioides sp. TaxID=35761 RepID=UPI002ED859CE